MLVAPAGSSMLCYCLLDVFRGARAQLTRRGGQTTAPEHPRESSVLVDVWRRDAIRNLMVFA